MTSLFLKAISKDDLSLSKVSFVSVLMTLRAWRSAAQWLSYEVPLLPLNSKSGVLCILGEITWFILNTDFISKILKGKTKAKCHWLYSFVVGFFFP